MSIIRLRHLLGVLLLALAGTPLLAHAQSLSFDEMRWRQIGPTRAGRARAVAGVPSQPNTFYAGFDNGGVWRTTDYGANWVPIFDDQPTGSIGAIGVSPTEPERDLRGERCGDHPSRPLDRRRDVQVGRCRTHLGAPRAPRDADDRRISPSIRGTPNRLFVAALGHPYGPNPERGVFRSTDGGRTFEKVLYKDEYTSANEVMHRSPRPEHDLRDALAAAAELHRRAGVRRQRDGHLQVHRRRHHAGCSSPNGLPSILQANIAIAPSEPNTLYAVIGAGAGGDRLLQVHRRRRALVPAGEGREQRTPRGAAGHAPALADRRR
jgi:hypothetical protein